MTFKLADAFRKERISDLFWYRPDCQSASNFAPLLECAPEADNVDLGRPASVMAGKTPLSVTQDQRRDLKQLSGSANRSEAGRARAIRLSLGARTSAETGEAFGRRKPCEQRFRRVREDTVRDWRSAFMRSAFMREGLSGIKRIKVWI